MVDYWGCYFQIVRLLGWQPWEGTDWSRGILRCLRETPRTGSGCIIEQLNDYHYASVYAFLSHACEINPRLRTAVYNVSSIEWEMPSDHITESGPFVLTTGVIYIYIKVPHQQYE